MEWQPPGPTKISGLVWPSTSDLPLDVLNVRLYQQPYTRVHPRPVLPTARSGDLRPNNNPGFFYDHRTDSAYSRHAWLSTLLASISSDSFGYFRWTDPVSQAIALVHSSGLRQIIPARARGNAMADYSLGRRLAGNGPIRAMAAATTTLHHAIRRPRTRDSGPCSSRLN